MWFISLPIPPTTVHTRSYMDKNHIWKPYVDQCHKVQEFENVSNTQKLNLGRNYDHTKPEKWSVLFVWESCLHMWHLATDLHLGKTWYPTLRDNCKARIPTVKCLVLLAHTLESAQTLSKRITNLLGFHDFIQSLHATVGTVPYIRPQLLPSTFTPINDSVIILSFDTK